MNENSRGFSRHYKLRNSISSPKTSLEEESTQTDKEKSKNALEQSTTP